jgi:hypothetical protein
MINSFVKAGIIFSLNWTKGVAMIQILNTFRDYIEVFATSIITVEDRIHTWEKYIQCYPELEKKMKNDYTDNGIDWYEHARKKVFVDQPKDYEKMLIAYNYLQIITPTIVKRAEVKYGMNFDITVVYYAALQNSAGWVDTYDKKIAVLIGLDKIASLDWHNEKALETLIAHELMHAIHFQVRGIDIIDPEFKDIPYDQGIWYLYEEGVAKYFEYSLSGHENGSRGDSWFNACLEREEDLKVAYLNALTGEGVQNFYGDWYQVYGISDTGYFMGARMIEELNKEMSFESIACMSKVEIEKTVLTYLKNY